MLSQRKIVLVLVVVVVVDGPVVLLVLVLEILCFHQCCLWLCVIVVMGTRGLSMVTGEVGEWAEGVFVSRPRARLRNRLRVGARVGLAAVGEWERRM